MTKKELHLSTVTAITAFAEANKLNEKIQEGLVNILDEHLAPKAGGARVNLDEVTKKNEAGKIAHIQCAVSGKWLPANLEHFYEDKSEKPAIIGIDGKGLKRLSKQAESVSKKFKATQKASIAAVTDDILALDMTAENAPNAAVLKKKLEAIKAEKPDYSSIKAIVPTSAGEETQTTEAT